MRNSIDYQRISGPWPTAIVPSQNILLDCHALQQEVSDLKEMLTQQQAYSCGQQNMIMELQQELEETRRQWKRQISLKVMYINREKETKRELETLIKYSDAETLSKASIASLVRNTARQKKKKDLHVDYEQLKIAHLISQDKFKVELQTEMEKNKCLQEELERLQVSFHEVKQRYEGEVLSVRQQADTLQRHLDEQIQQKTIIKKKYEELQVVLQHSQETSAAELKEEREKNKLLQEELDRCRVSYHKMESELSNARQQAASLQDQLGDEVRAHVSPSLKRMHVIDNSKTDPEALHQKMAEDKTSPIRRSVPLSSRLREMVGLPDNSPRSVMRSIS